MRGLPHVYLYLLRDSWLRWCPVLSSDSDSDAAVRKNMLLNESARMATKMAQISVMWGENHLWVEACKETPCGEENPETCQERKTSYLEEEDREAPLEKRYEEAMKTFLVQ